MLYNSFHRSIFLWLLANLFFAYQFVIRLSVSLLSDQIIEKFHVDISTFSMLAGYYYIGYAGSQIPLSVLIDRYSFKIITCISIFITACGTFLFVVTNDWTILVLSRFLIGIGSGVAFISITKIIHVCFDKRYHALLFGFSFSFGLLGAVFGMSPMECIFNKFHYTIVCNVLGVIGLILSFLMFFFGDLKNKQDLSVSPLNEAIYPIFKLFGNYKILSLGILGGLLIGSLEGFADIWAISFFDNCFNFKKGVSSSITGYLYIGMCFGGPLLTLLSRLFNSIELAIVSICAMIIVVFCLLFYISSQEVNSLVCMLLMFWLGVLCCYQVLIFLIANKIVEHRFSGLAIAIINCVNMSFGHVFHKVIAMMSSYSSGISIVNGNTTCLTRIDFIYGLSVIPIASFIALLSFLFLYKHKVYVLKD